MASNHDPDGWDSPHPAAPGSAYAGSFAPPRQRWAGEAPDPDPRPTAPPAGTYPPVGLSTAYPPAGTHPPVGSPAAYPPAGPSTSYPPARLSAAFPPAGPSAAYPPVGTHPPAGLSTPPPPAEGWPGQPPAGATAPEPRSRVRTVLMALLAVLLVTSVAEAAQLYRLGARLDRTERRLAERTDAGDRRTTDLEGRTGALEKQAGSAFQPEAVASQVLPSVFRVRAGRFIGTAFAVGKPAAGGGSNLLTNFHVVESVWQGGGRRVDIEHTDQRFPATIVRVDKKNDLAQLRTTASFTGLGVAGAEARPGQQVVVVGAPLGLTDTVTTGVVSATRKANADGGPMIQFDAPINPGNSGGPVINGAKQVVGIATAKARDAEGIGLAIPIKVACTGFAIC
ncbi:trypsin-like peptidase domain-containing protein [Plantactinospora siamensis]|uniref:Trypsin-like peptidase domain-containing protein n=1 Tax=Plantactinospora siamensis TaxID=555372 RepID=A0ABV6NTV0_9ACTN